MKKILTITVMGLMSAVVAAQNLNPTVNITNTYESKAGAGDRVVLPMSVPDSLSKFDYKFDYSVFDSPYKGAFEFTPYAVQFSPERSVPDVGKLYLRAGAGYSLHPLLQAVWNPVEREGAKLNVYQDFSGYYGKYRTVIRDITSYPMLTVKGQRYSGYDFEEKFGADFRFTTSAVSGTVGAFYNGIFNKDDISDNRFNSAVASFEVMTRRLDALELKLSAAADLASDKVSHPFGPHIVSQCAYDVNVSAVSKMWEKISPALDLRIKGASYSGALDFARSFLGYAVTPHVRFKAGPADIDAGVCLDGASDFNIAPVVKAELKMFGDALTTYGEVRGGAVFNTYSELRRTSHWFSPGTGSQIKMTRELINAGLGFRSCIASRFQFDVKGGWASFENKPLWGLLCDGGTLYPRLGFADVSYAYADLLLAWKSGKLQADAGVYARFSNLKSSSTVFDLPKLRGDARVRYNFGERLNVGVSAGFSTDRKCTVDDVELQLQPYVDLGVFGEYRINSRWSVWLKGANLLNEGIQIVPMHVENGINFTAGICLSL